MASDSPSVRRAISKRHGLVVRRERMSKSPLVGAQPGQKLFILAEEIASLWTQGLICLSDQLESRNPFEVLVIVCRERN